jgi:hypothetical protein
MAEAFLVPAIKKVKGGRGYRKKILASKKFLLHTARWQKKYITK